MKQAEEKYKQCEGEAKGLRDEKDSQRQSYLNLTKALQDKLAAVEQQNQQMKERHERELLEVFN